MRGWLRQPLKSGNGATRIELVGALVACAVLGVILGLILSL